MKKETFDLLNENFKELLMCANGKQKEEMLQRVCDNTSHLTGEGIFFMFDEMFKDILGFVLEGNEKTNIASVKLKKEYGDIEPSKEFESLNEYMTYLLSCTGKKEEVQKVSAFIKYYNDDLENNFLYNLAIKKAVGITTTTFNKVFPQQKIEKFKTQQAKAFKEIKDGEAIYNVKGIKDKQVIISRKIDGERCHVFVTDNGVVLRSKNGKVLTGYDELVEKLSNLESGYVYDGEIQALAITGEENSQELFKMTTSITRSKGIKKGISIILYDVVPIEDFNSGICTKGAYSRKMELIDILKKHKAFYGATELIKFCKHLYVGAYDLEKIESITRDEVANGQEGTMVQLKDGAYYTKRHNEILKVKLFTTVDVRVLDVYKGKEGMNSERLGGIYVDFKGDKVKVGIGFSDSERDEFYDNPSSIVGKIVTVKYFEEFTDENGEKDLRFSSFEGIREDKSTPSYN